MTIQLEDRVAGCILGTALGDGIGLPLEGISRERQKRFCSDVGRSRLLFGRLMVSDDTEHTCMTAQALAASGGDPDRFGSRLAGLLRGWLLAVPAGAGLATLKATLKLCVGVSWKRSGVYSAGNGPAMRSAVLGVCCGNDPVKLRTLVSISTRITHTDPKAEFAALAVGVAADYASNHEAIDPRGYFEHLTNVMSACPNDNDSMEAARELLHLVELAVVASGAGESSVQFADSLGLSHGVSGYAYHTVPVVLHAWFRNPRDFRAAIEGIVRCGGDTDSTAAILGGIVGAAVGTEGLPQEWLDSRWEWPRSATWMRALAPGSGAISV